MDCLKSCIGAVRLERGDKREDEGLAFQWAPERIWVQLANQDLVQYAIIDLGDSFVAWPVEDNVVL